MDKVYILAMDEEKDANEKRIASIEGELKAFLSDQGRVKKAIPFAGYAVVFGDEKNGWQISVAPHRVSFSQDSHPGHNFQELITFDLQGGEFVCADEPMNSDIVSKGEKGLHRMLMIPDFDQLSPDDIEKNKFVPKKFNE